MKQMYYSLSEATELVALSTHGHRNKFDFICIRYKMYAHVLGVLDLNTADP